MATPYKTKIAEEIEMSKNRLKTLNNEIKALDGLLKKPDIKNMPTKERQKAKSILTYAKNFYKYKSSKISVSGLDGILTSYNKLSTSKQINREKIYKESMRLIKDWDRELNDVWVAVHNNCVYCRRAISGVPIHPEYY